MIIMNRQKDAAVVAAPQLTLNPTTTMFQKVDHDGDQQDFCDICSQLFSTTRSLKQHTKTFHKDHKK